MARSPSDQHREAVARRLDLLSRQLDEACRPAPEAGAAPEPLAPASGEDWWEGYTRVSGAAPASPAEGPAQQPARQPARPPLTIVRDLSTVQEQAPPAPTPVLPSAPGRHAARREVGTSAAGGLPATMLRSIRLGPAQLAVVAALVAVVLAVVCWQLVRGRPQTQQASTTVAAAEPIAAVSDDVEGAASAATPSGAPGASARVTVDVAGRVRRPGIVVLPAGSRVVDALRRAGGVRPGVDTTSLNLARPLVDGEQVVVGVPGAGPAPPATPGDGTTSSTAPAALVDLNTATQAQLEELPEVGPVTATAIITYRDENGGFTAIDQLLDVDGIGPATLERLTPLVTV